MFSVIRIIVVEKMMFIGSSVKDNKIGVELIKLVFISMIIILNWD